jgi:hypothetical protein
VHKQCLRSVPVCTDTRPHQPRQITRTRLQLHSVCRDRFSTASVPQGRVFDALIGTGDGVTFHSINEQNRQCTYNLTSRRVPVSHCCREEAISTTYSVYVCGLTYPACNAHAPNYIVISGLSRCSTFLHIIPLTVRLFEGGGDVIEHKMCFEFLYNFCLKYFCLKIIQRDVTINVNSCRIVIKKKRIFSTDFRNKLAC